MPKEAETKSPLSTYVTARSFEQMLWQTYHSETHQRDAAACTTPYLSSEETDGEAYLDRKNAARIVHEFLKQVSMEADEADWSLAKRLQDLYDCHICVNHVAQVYVKGIMKANQDIFGMKVLLTQQEALEIAEKVVYKNLRQPPRTEDFPQGGERLSYEEAMHKQETVAQLRLIDVRPRQEYEKEHLRGAISIPLGAILKNPYQVSDHKKTPLLFFCDNGYQSEIAASCVIEAGYYDVGYFGRDV